MSGPRIGIDITSALTQGGGIGRYTRELVRALVATDTPNNYTLFSAQTSQSSPVPFALTANPSVRYRRALLDERWLYRLWYRLRVPLPVQTFSGPIDLFHSPDFVLPPVSGQVPTLLTVHDLSFVHYPDTFPPSLVSYLNRVVPWSISRASHVLADSISTKRDLTAQWHVSPDKITVLYSGVSDDYRPISDRSMLQQVKTKYGLDESPYLLAVGTLQPRKNYEMLIRAFAPVAAAYPHNLAIAGGKGWMEDTMMAEAARLGIGDRVRFLGFVADQDLPALYSAATLFVFPSIYEGFGLPVLEAMTCGTPVVVSDSSSLPEVVGEAGLLLPATDQDAWTESMKSLLADPAAQAALAQKGLKQASAFSWQHAANQLLGIYATLLDKEGVSRHNTPR